MTETTERRAQRHAILRHLREWWDWNPEFNFVEAVEFFVDGHNIDNDKDSDVLDRMRHVVTSTKDLPVVDDRQLEIPGVE